MVGQRPRQPLTFCVDREPGSANQDHSRVNGSLPKHQFAEILVFGHQQRIVLVGQGEHHVIRHARMVRSAVPWSPCAAAAQREKREI